MIVAGVYCVPVSKCPKSYNWITEGPQQEVSDRQLFSQSLADVLELEKKKMERHLPFRYKPDAVCTKHWCPERKLLISLHCFAIWFLRQVLM